MKQKRNGGTYNPPQKILEKYADVLVNFAIGGGVGMKKGEVVRIVSSESAKPLFAELRKAVYRSGGHVISTYLPDDVGFDKYNINMTKDFYDIASAEQLSFFPEKYMKGIVDTIDHQIFVDAEANKHALQGIDPKKIMKSGEAVKPYRDWLRHKENAGKFTWTIGLYGTEAMAHEAGLSLSEYWKQIIDACFLNDKDPIATWKKVYKDLEVYREKLNAITKKTEKFHVKGPDVDLWVTLGEKRRWMGGSGRNIPSFELFTSPDWRGTEGWIRFNQPLYRYGVLVEGIELQFKNGRVVSSKAKKNEKVLKAMIETPGADRIGEWSLTDKRFSKITKFMAETLFDENIGGPYGNTHIALGASYHDCYDGNPVKVSKKEWERLAFNDSSVHTDIISTKPRTVTAHLKNGTQKIIYTEGMFTDSL